MYIYYTTTIPLLYSSVLDPLPAAAADVARLVPYLSTQQNTNS